jgi:hypothetical protein
LDVHKDSINIALAEAGPCGFVIWRHLSTQGLTCEVIAPSSIPKRSGDRVKPVLSLSKGSTGATP